MALDIVPQVLFNYFIGYFQLAACAGVVGHGRLEAYSQPPIELLHDLGEEDTPPVGENYLWLSMESPNVADQQVDQLFCCHGLSTRYQVGHFSHAVNHCQNDIKAIGRRQISNKVIANICPWARWYQERFECGRFQLQA